MLGAISSGRCCALGGTVLARDVSLRGTYAVCPPARKVGPVKINKLTCVAVAVVASLGLAACGGSESSDGDAITIGSVHPLTGALAGVGGLMNDGAKLAVEDINKDGGIESLDGAKLKLSDGDSKGKAETGQSEAQRLIDDDAVALVG